MPRARRAVCLSIGQFPSSCEALPLESRVLLSASVIRIVPVGHLATPPRIVASKLTGHDGFVNGIVLTFDQPMNETAAQDVARYVVSQRKTEVNALGYLSIFAKRTKDVVTRPFVKSADYDPASQTVTLSFAKVTKAGGTFQVSSTNLPGSRRGRIDPKALVNTKGESLGGVQMGGRFSIVVGQKRPSSR